MASLRRMIRFSKSNCSSSINPCSLFSSNSPASRLNYGPIRSYNSSSNSWKYPESISRISHIVKPDGNGGYYVDKICLLRSLDNECKTATDYKISSEAKKKESCLLTKYPWLQLEDHDKVVGGRYGHIKDYWDANKFLDTAEQEAYDEARQVDTKVALSVHAFCIGSILLVPVIRFYI